MKTVDNGVHYIVGFIFCMFGVFHNEKYTTSTLKKKKTDAENNGN